MAFFLLLAPVALDNLSLDELNMFVASLGDTVIAKSEDCLVIENNIYFPENDVKTEYLFQTETLTRCPWKGMATYFDIKTMENSVKDGAWSYLRPKSKAKRIKGHIAFWKDVVVKEFQAN